MCSPYELVTRVENDTDEIKNGRRSDKNDSSMKVSFISSSALWVFLICDDFFIDFHLPGNLVLFSYIVRRESL